MFKATRLVPCFIRGIRVALTLPGPPLSGVRLIAPALSRVVALARNPARYESPAAQAFRGFLGEGLRP